MWKFLVGKSRQVKVEGSHQKKVFLSPQLFLLSIEEEFWACAIDVPELTFQKGKFKNWNPKISDDKKSNGSNLPNPFAAFGATMGSFLERKKGNCHEALNWAPILKQTNLFRRRNFFRKIVWWWRQRERQWERQLSNKVANIKLVSTTARSYRV